MVVGQWVMRCEARTLDDIRAMGGNSSEDERRFAAAKRVSEINLAAYQKFLQPWIKGMVTPQMAESMRNLHPLRMQYEAFSSQNPFMSAVKSLAEQISEDRKQVSTDNPFFAFQEQVSKQIVNALDNWRDSQEALSEAAFPRRPFGACFMSGRCGGWWTSAASKRCVAFVATTPARG